MSLLYLKLLIIIIATCFNCEIERGKRKEEAVHSDLI